MEENWAAFMEAAQSGNAGVYYRLLTEISAWLKRYYAQTPASRHARGRRAGYAAGGA